MNVDDFLQGQRDCKDGIQHVAGKSKDYNDGYSTEYWAQEMLTEMGLRHERH